MELIEDPDAMTHIVMKQYKGMVMNLLRFDSYFLRFYAGDTQSKIISEREILDLEKFYRTHTRPKAKKSVPKNVYRFSC